MAEEMLNGFDHTVHREEVETRWGRDAYAAGDDWWRSKTAEEKAAWQAEQAALASDWVAAATASAESKDATSDAAESTSAGPTGPAAQVLARRQYDRLASVPGTPGYPQGPTKEYFAGLAELYAADVRFAAHYGGPEGAAFVRAAMLEFAEREL